MSDSGTDPSTLPAEAPSGPSPQMAWWGDFALPLRSARSWQIGHFHLHLWRTDVEIRVSWWRDHDPGEDTLRVDRRAEELPPADAVLTRFAFARAPETITLRPAMADRPVVATPVQPFLIPPHEEAQVYVSAPLWLQMLVDGDLLFEIELHRPSDTWFGPDTRVGELCYASRTAARLSLTNLPLLPQRAVSAIHVRNLAPTLLEIERLKLPAPNLVLYAGEDGRLWTEVVPLVREADGDFAAMRLGSGPPAEAGAVNTVAPPRARPLRDTPLRAFGRLLRRGGPHG